MSDKQKHPTLSFRDGMVWLGDATDHPLVTKFFKRHPTGSWIAPAYRYDEIISSFSSKRIYIRDCAAQFFSAGELTHRERLDPFDFQKEAIAA